jgi:hypothetical protein
VAHDLQRFIDTLPVRGAPRHRAGRVAELPRQH